MVGDGAGVLSWHHSKEWGRNLNDRRERCRRIGVATLAYYDFNSWGVGGHFLIRSGNEVRATASTEKGDKKVPPAPKNEGEKASLRG